MTIALLIAQPLATCWASEDFLKNMRKAEKIKEDPDKIEFYDRAIKAWEPTDGGVLLAECLFRRGEALFNRSELAKAEPDLSRAVELDPGNVQARLIRGRLRLRLARRAAAIKDLSDVAAAAPEGKDGYYWLGEAYLADGQHEPAMRSFQRAAQLDAADYRPVLGQGRVWLARREFLKAADALRAADALAKHRCADVLTALAVAEAGLGQRDKALGHYGQALPMHDRLLVEYQRAGALAELSEARQRAARAYFGRGRLLEFMSRIDEALADYGRACELGSDEACRRAKTLAPSAAAEPKPQRTQPPPKPKKRRLPPPDSDSGDRIYAN